MAAYWYRFTVTGDPNGGGALNWPKYTADGDQNIRLDGPPGGIAVQSGLRKDACDFWDAQPVVPPPASYSA